MTNFQIQDDRKTGYYKIDTIFIKGGWAKALGPCGISVYNALCCAANNDSKESFYKYETIADLIGCSRRQVIRSIEDLTVGGLIEVTSRKRKDGTQTSNLIRLIQYTEWHSPEIIARSVQSRKDAAARYRKNKQSDSESPGQSDSESPGQSDSESPHELTPLSSLTKPTGGGDSPPAPEILQFQSEKENPQPAIREPDKVALSPGEAWASGAAPPPAAEVIKRATGLYPRKQTWPKLRADVGDDPVKLRQLGQAVEGWVLAGHNPQNVGGMLDWYAEGKTSTKPNAPPNGKALKMSKADELYFKRYGGKF